MACGYGCMGEALTGLDTRLLSPKAMRLTAREPQHPQKPMFSMELWS
jgi:hypothetical protein